MGNKTITVLDGTIAITVRPSNYMSSIVHTGLLKFLKENFEFVSEDTEWMLGNFAYLVSRTIKVAHVNKTFDTDGIGNEWVKLWGFVESKEYIQALEMYLELNVNDDDTSFTSIWNDSIASTEDTLGKDNDLVPPDKLDESQKKE